MEFKVRRPDGTWTLPGQLTKETIQAKGFHSHKTHQETYLADCYPGMKSADPKDACTDRTPTPMPNSNYGNSCLLGGVNLYANQKLPTYKQPIHLSLVSGGLDQKRLLKSFRTYIEEGVLDLAEGQSIIFLEDDEEFIIQLAAKLMHFMDFRDISRCQGGVQEDDMPLSTLGAELTLNTGTNKVVMITLDLPNTRTVGSGMEEELIHTYLCQKSYEDDLWYAFDDSSCEMIDISTSGPENSVFIDNFKMVQFFSSQTVGERKHKSTFADSSTYKMFE